jgi:hypothetical protein
MRALSCALSTSGPRSNRTHFGEWPHDRACTTTGRALGGGEVSRLGVGFQRRGEGAQVELGGWLGWRGWLGRRGILVEVDERRLWLLRLRWLARWC